MEAAICSQMDEIHDSLASYTVLFLMKETSVGRKKLAEILGVGEATARTVLSKLKSQGLVEANRRGAKLTAKGRDEAYGLASFMEPADVELPEKYGEVTVALIIKRNCSFVDTGVRERDEAVRGGADGALIIIRRDGRYVFPGSGYEYRVTARPEPLDGECLVVTWSSTRAGAIYGALRAATSVICARR